MATYYCRTDGNDANAGTADTSGGAWRTLSKAGSVVAAGDTVYVRGNAGNASSYPTSSLDYTESSYFTPGAGSEAAGYVKWIGLGTMPTIGAGGMIFYAATRNYFEGLYIVATGAALGSFGIINGGNCVISNCIINIGNQAGTIGISLNNGMIKGTEIYGGTTSPTSSSGCYAIYSGNYSITIHGCKIRYCRDHGIYCDVGSVIIDCLIYRNVGNGIILNGSSIVGATIIGNTIDANSGHGIYVAATNAAVWHVIRNNCITNHTQSGKSGINCATSSSDPRKSDWGYNNLYNNTSNYTNVTADSTDISIDPTYADAANGDFTPSNTSLKVAFPTSF